LSLMGMRNLRADFTPCAGGRATRSQSRDSVRERCSAQRPGGAALGSFDAQRRELGHAVS